eukprot:Hpha_TRINITY_DN12101_c0_g2::TRINITY_DN12101_c0_g2_i1::g.81958::m.81958
MGEGSPVGQVFGGLDQPSVVGQLAAGTTLRDPESGLAILLAPPAHLNDVLRQRFLPVFAQPEGQAVVHFMEEVNKMSHWGRDQKRVVLVTSKALYLALPETGEVRRCVPITQINRVILGHFERPPYAAIGLRVPEQCDIFLTPIVPPIRGADPVTETEWKRKAQQAMGYMGNILNVLLQKLTGFTGPRGTQDLPWVESVFRERMPKPQTEGLSLKKPPRFEQSRHHVQVPVYGYGKVGQLLKEQLSVSRPIPPMELPSREDQQSPTRWRARPEEVEREHPLLARGSPVPLRVAAKAAEPPQPGPAPVPTDYRDTGVVCVDSATQAFAGSPTYSSESPRRNPEYVEPPPPPPPGPPPDHSPQRSASPTPAGLWGSMLRVPVPSSPYSGTTAGRRPPPRRLPIAADLTRREAGTAVAAAANAVPSVPLQPPPRSRAGLDAVTAAQPVIGGAGASDMALLAPTSDYLLRRGAQRASGSGEDFSVSSTAAPSGNVLPYPPPPAPEAADAVAATLQSLSTQQPPPPPVPPPRGSGKSALLNGPPPLARFTHTADFGLYVAPRAGGGAAAALAAPPPPPATAPASLPPSVVPLPTTASYHTRPPPPEGPAAPVTPSSSVPPLLAPSRGVALRGDTPSLQVEGPVAAALAVAAAAHALAQVPPAGPPAVVAAIQQIAVLSSERAESLQRRREEIDLVRSETAKLMQQLGSDEDDQSRRQKVVVHGLQEQLQSLLSDLEFEARGYELTAMLPAQGTEAVHEEVTFERSVSPAPLSPPASPPQSPPTSPPAAAGHSKGLSPPRPPEWPGMDALSAHPYPSYPAYPYPYGYPYAGYPTPAGYPTQGFAPGWPPSQGHPSFPWTPNPETPPAAPRRKATATRRRLDSPGSGGVRTPRSFRARVPSSPAATAPWR